MRIRETIVGLCGLWLAVSSAFATNRAVMVESVAGTQSLPQVSIQFLPGMSVFSTTGIARIYFNPTGNTYLAVQADLMDIVSPAVTNWFLGSNLLLYTVGGGSNPVLRIGGDGMDVQVGTTNSPSPASIPSRAYVDGLYSSATNLFITNGSLSGTCDGNYYSNFCPFPTPFIAPPVVVLGKYTNWPYSGEPEWLSSSTTGFWYRLRSGIGIDTGRYSVSWIARIGCTNYSYDGYIPTTIWTTNDAGQLVLFSESINMTNGFWRRIGNVVTLETNTGVDAWWKTNSSGQVEMK